ncbi:hypothetical protein [Ornithinimicrobium panacihumi]|uniref:hypothetical protein n=1 Tax=Ornithinimicrobium panacihumi TaxID=2008449 RepID=UPI003F8C82E9
MRLDARGARLAALVCASLLLLATTQPWLDLVVRLAPGLPRTATQVQPPQVSWVAATAVVGALGLLGSLVRAPRLLPTVASLGLLASCAGVLLARGARPSGAGEVLSATTTPWYAVALASSVLAAALALLAQGLARSGRPVRGGDRTGDGPRATATLDPHELARRAQARAWSELSEGRDPTLGA